MKQTPNYRLPLWSPWDRPSGRIAAGAASAVDGALAETCAMVSGAYVGDGSTTRNISLGHKPKAVLVESASGHRDSYSLYGGLALSGNPLRNSSGGSVTVTEDGFCLTGTPGSPNFMELNCSYTTYLYMAIY